MSSEKRFRDFELNFRLVLTIGPIWKLNRNVTANKNFLYFAFFKLRGLFSWTNLYKTNSKIFILYTCRIVHVKKLNGLKERKYPYFHNHCYTVLASHAPSPEPLWNYTTKQPQNLHLDWLINSKYTATRSWLFSKSLSGKIGRTVCVIDSSMITWCSCAYTTYHMMASVVWVFFSHFRFCLRMRLSQLMQLKQKQTKIPQEGGRQPPPHSFRTSTYLFAARVVDHFWSL